MVLSRNGRAQRGVGLLEIILALGIVGLVGIQAFRVSEDLLQNNKAVIAAEQIKMLNAAVERLVKEDYQDLVTRTGNSGGLIELNIATDLQGDRFLSARFVNRNPYGGTYRVFLRQGATPVTVPPSGPSLETIILSNGGTSTLTPQELGRIAVLTGAAGGFVSDGATTTLRGSFGGFTVNLTQFGVADGTRSFGAATFYDSRMLATNFLHRYQIPGVPEANRMHTHIHMNGNRLDDVANVRAVSMGNVNNTVFSVRDANTGAFPTDPATDAGNMLFQIQASGAITRPDAAVVANAVYNQAASYAITAEGDILGRDLTTRDGIDVCTVTSVADCGIRFGWVGSPAGGVRGPLVRNSSENLLVAPPTSNQNFEVQVQGTGAQAGQTAVRLGSQGYGTFRDRILACEANAANCFVQISDAGSLVDANDGFLRIVAGTGGTNGLLVAPRAQFEAGVRINNTLPSSTFGLEVATRAWVGNAMTICGSINGGNCGLTLGSAGSIFDRGDWMVAAPAAGRNGLLVAGSSQQFQVEGTIVGQRNAVVCTTNFTGCGIQISDDGGFYDFNNGWTTATATSGLWVNNGLRVGSTSIFEGTMNVNGQSFFNNQANFNSTVNASNQTIFGGVFIYNSDRRLKDDIRPLNETGSVLDRITRLEGVSYRLKAQGANGPRHIGLIAQDVHQVFPELVNQVSGTDQLGVNYGQMVSPLIEAVKELARENNELKQRLEAQEQGRAPAR